MAISTLKSHVSRALDFYKKTDLYIGIGKTERWSRDDLGDRFDDTVDYDENPPAPRNTDEILDLIGFKRVETKAMVIQDDEGTIKYRGTKWKVVTPDEAVKVNSRWVYVAVNLQYNELPTDKAYRQVGLYSGLRLNDDVITDSFAVTPDQVSDMGLLEVIDNRKPVYRDTDVREKIMLILEF